MTTTKAKIFISHSAKDQLARAVRDKLVARLEDDMNLEPVLDEDLEPGDTWRKKLHYWLGCCDGAVILFSRDALERSAWVKKEATILSWRKSLDPRLRLIPVPLGDVSREELTQDYFGSLELGEIQWARLDGGADSETAVDDLVERIAACFLGLSIPEAEPALQLWIKRVAGYLKKAEPCDLEAAAAALGIKDADWKDSCELTVAMAHHLLHCGLDDDSLQALGEVMPGLPHETKDSLYTSLAPLWVREEAARHILPVARRVEAQRCLAINASYQDTGPLYIDRATCNSTNTITLRTSGIVGEASVIETLSAFEKGFCEQLKITEWRIPEQERLHVLQSSLRDHSVLIFILLEGSSVRNEILAALHSRYPMATIVLLTGPSLPDPEILGLPELVRVEPALAEGEEVKGFSKVTILKNKARPNSAQGR